MIKMVCLLGVLLILPQIGNGQAKAKTETILIPSDQMPPPSAEAVVPTHPFFSESTGNEVMEHLLELEERVKNLESRIPQSAEKNLTVKSEGSLSIESKGDIEIKTPGVIKMKAKSLEMPSKGE